MKILVALLTPFLFVSTMQAELQEPVLFYPTEHPLFSVNQGFGDFHIQHPGTYHRLESIQGSYAVIRLDDHSTWDFTREYDCPPINDISNVYIVTRNCSLFSSYPYRIVHLETDQSIEVSCLGGAPRNNPQEVFIVKVDVELATLYLSDGSRWEVNKGDIDTLAQWRQGETLSIGTNCGPQKFFYPHVLIHPEQGSDVAASCTYWSRDKR